MVAIVQQPVTLTFPVGRSTAKAVETALTGAVAGAVEFATVKVAAVDLSYSLTLTFEPGTVITAAAADVIAASLLEALATYGVTEQQIRVALAVRALCYVLLFSRPVIQACKTQGGRDISTHTDSKQPRTAAQALLGLLPKPPSASLSDILVCGSVFFSMAGSQAIMAGGQTTTSGRHRRRLIDGDTQVDVTSAQPPRKERHLAHPAAMRCSAACASCLGYGVP